MDVGRTLQQRVFGFRRDVFPTLHRTEEQGLLTSRAEVIDGRPHRIYRTTPQGIAALDEGRKAVAELAAEIFATPQKDIHDE